jgi:hypothetical protein
VALAAGVVVDPDYLARHPVASDLVALGLDLLVPGLLDLVALAPGYCPVLHLVSVPGYLVRHPVVLALVVHGSDLLVPVVLAHLDYCLVLRLALVPVPSNLVLLDLAALAPGYYPVPAFDFFPCPGLFFCGRFSLMFLS